MIISVDGYAGCGKSTIARDLASALGFMHVDSGAMYRAVSYYFLKRLIDLSDRNAVLKALDQIHLELKYNDNESQVWLGGKYLKTELRSREVNAIVSPVSAQSDVRKKLVEIQRASSLEWDIVMDGRDIGTVVFPNADVKIFVIASIEERTERRWKELKEKGIEMSYDSVLQNLLERDDMDTSREDSPLRKAEDAITIDTTHHSRQSQLDAALEIIFQKFPELKKHYYSK